MEACDQIIGLSTKQGSDVHILMYISKLVQCTVRGSAEQNSLCWELDTHTTTISGVNANTVMYPRSIYYRFAEVLF